MSLTDLYNMQIHYFELFKILQNNIIQNFKFKDVFAITFDSLIVYDRATVINSFNHTNYMIIIIDVDECHEGISKCSDICTNTERSYTCSCPTGFRLANDNYSCTGLS